MGLGKDHLSANLESLSSVVAEILKGNPKFWGASLAQGHAYFSSGCNFKRGLVKPKLQTSSAP